jgi:hypothetical protein
VLDELSGMENAASREPSSHRSTIHIPLLPMQLNLGDRLQAFDR